MKILFITWDGPQVSYLETLFLPIFKKLAEVGIDFEVLQFTWGDKVKIKNTSNACLAYGFPCRQEIVWRYPVSLASFFTAIKGSFVIRSIIRERGVDAVMCRSTLPAFAALLALRGSSLPMIFDADGLPLDERVDFAGLSASGLVYRVLRDIEAEAVRRADIVLCRTHKALNILIARAGASISPEKFNVVSNGREPRLFFPGNEFTRLQTRRRLNITDTAPILIYVGSIGPQYCLDEMLGLFEQLHRKSPDAHLLILTGSPELLIIAMQKFPKLVQFITVKVVPAYDVPEYLACADVGLALRRSSYSMQAVAPIKIGEYLLCGVPVIASAGIGEGNCLNENVGLSLQNLSTESIHKATDWMLSKVMLNREDYRKAARELGIKKFSLVASVKSYKRALLGESI